MTIKRKLLLSSVVLLSSVLLILLLMNIQLLSFKKRMTIEHRMADLNREVLLAEVNVNRMLNKRVSSESVTLSLYRADSVLTAIPVSPESDDALHLLNMKLLLTEYRKQTTEMVRVYTQFAMAEKSVMKKSVDLLQSLPGIAVNSSEEKLRIMEMKFWVNRILDVVHREIILSRDDLRFKENFQLARKELLRISAERSVLAIDRQKMQESGVEEFLYGVELLYKRSVELNELIYFQQVSANRLRYSLMRFDRFSFKKSERDMLFQISFQGILSFIMLIFLTVGTVMVFYPLFRKFYRLEKFLDSLDNMTMVHSREQLIIEGNDELGKTALALNRMLKRLEESFNELIAGKKELDQIIDLIPGHLFIRDEKGVIVRVNQAMAQFYGMKSVEMVGLDIRAVVIEKDELDNVLNDDKQLLEVGGYHMQQQQVLTDILGEKHIFKMVRVPYTVYGNPAVLGVGTDITQSIAATQEIEQLNNSLEEKVIHRTEELTRANREIEAFSYSVSHDLRAPLRTIHGYSQIVLEDEEEALSEEGKRLLVRIVNNVERMNTLIDGLLNLSRINFKALQIQRIDLTALTETIFARITEGTTRQYQLINQHNVFGYADKALIYSVLENLLSNAWKFTGAQDITIVEFGETEHHGAKCFFVKDNGVGFDMQHYDKLFGTFQRLHRAEDFDGIGVGLATVQRIINRHGGMIWAEGEINKGAVFYFTLPEKSI